MRRALAVAFTLALSAAGCRSETGDGAASTPPTLSPMAMPPAPTPEWIMDQPIDGPLPGVDSFEPDLAARIEAALAARPESTEPRTRHLRDDGEPRFTNRLVLESSPYLLQHAHNPVNWRPWGDDAFEEAERLGRPVLLSVGYSTCHWCHVMEEESFEDLEIARILNERYVAIKVDREQRPDVDAVYMSAVQTITGRGGWPMTVWLTADRRPYHAGTYFPPRDGDRGVRIGFRTLLLRLADMHAAERERVDGFSSEIVERVRASLGAASAPGAQATPGPEVLEGAVRAYRDRYDRTFGGVGRAPKFPSSLPIRVLLREHARGGDAKALEMSLETLERMAAGGLRDQLGGGFHRYSTDRSWLVPHFEKMLYDNALLTLAYLDGWQATGEAALAEVARDTVAYVLREMTDPQGGFYSATDADSLTPSGERAEGWYFTWTPEELEEALGAERARIVGATFGVTPGGHLDGRSILHLPQPIERVAPSFDLEPGALSAMLDEARARLLEVRATRPPPLRDEKVLAAWNGLMISAAARAGWLLDEPRFVTAAERAASFVLERMRDDDGRLRRAWTAGSSDGRGYLDDHAFLLAGLIDLFEASGEPRWLDEATALARMLDEHFHDETGGGFFFTADDHERLLVREKPRYDGAEPSGSSVAALALLRLAELGGEDRWRELGEGTIRAFGALLRESPTALSEMLLAVDWAAGPVREVVLVAPRERAELAPFLEVLRTHFVPRLSLVIAVEGEDLERQAARVPFARDRRALEGRPTAYVCENRVCELPTHDPRGFAEQLSRR